MGRKVTKREDASWYIPDIDDNRQDPEPFMVLLGPLSGKDMQKLERATLGVSITRNQQANFLERAHTLIARLIATCVQDVKNYSVSDKDGNVFEPKTGEELMQAILTAGASELPILDDIVEALKDRSRLEEGLAKN